MEQRTRPQPGDREVRKWSIDGGVELRADEAAGTLLFTGYATVFESPYEMYGGPPYGWIETVAEGGLDKSLRERPDVQFLVNHEGLPLARTKSGTLRLATDTIGLRTEADLEPTDPDVQQLAPKMARKDIDEMSFAFRVVRQEWNEDYTERRLVELNIHKGDVSVVNYGANPATAGAQLRSLDLLARLVDVDVDELVAEIRSDGHRDPGAVVAQARDQLERLAAEFAPPAPEPTGEEWRAALAAQRAALL